jgi:hypothetical protein
MIIFVVRFLISDLDIVYDFNFVWNMDKLELCEVIYRYGVKITSLMVEVVNML